MADERYEWLDQEAAERLLRGEPVGPVDDHARAQAERLAQALAEARSVPFARTTAEAELPGEAAALAAFRKATAERAVGRSPIAHTAASAELGGVRLAPVLHPARRWGRSLKYGLAAAVAAVAVGGVAVASGTGMLPFDRDAPTPAGSVSAVDTPEPVVSGSPDDGFGSGGPSAPPTGDGRSPDASSSAPTPPVVAGSGGTDGDSGGTAEPGRSKGSPDPDGDTSGVTNATNVKACQDFRAGRLDDSGVRRLTKEARTGETVRRFCDRVLAGGSDSGSSSGATKGGSTRDTSGGDSSGGKGDGKGGDDDSAGEGDRAGGSSGAGGKSTGGKSTGGKSTGGSGAGGKSSGAKTSGGKTSGGKGGGDRNTGRGAAPDQAPGKGGRASTTAVEPAPQLSAEPVTHEV
ncbi:hypothetical protein J7E93_14485 [Streptomyces sp. ISL-36]|uniref:hypothetical protein n=1 Tax=Streptomyces sp. ISL-36 TaxID=2819182 RepID=UPI001BE517FB|nr:hypothetical protein [Streptomyces sp. ISL-36]MBT2441296.1 hypothetical protein [Streptomyces sp. ISL-36]